jgi:hypothetical protein
MNRCVDGGEGGCSWPYAATRKYGGSEISMVKHKQQKQQNDDAQ